MQRVAYLVMLPIYLLVCFVELLLLPLQIFLPQLAYLPVSEMLPDTVARLLIVPREHPALPAEKELMAHLLLIYPLIAVVLACLVADHLYLAILLLPVRLIVLNLELLVLEERLLIICLILKVAFLLLQ